MLRTTALSLVTFAAVAGGALAGAGAASAADAPPPCAPSNQTMQGAIPDFGGCFNPNGSSTAAQPAHPDQGRGGVAAGHLRARSLVVDK